MSAKLDDYLFSLFDKNLINIIQHENYLNRGTEVEIDTFFSNVGQNRRPEFDG